jgi:hypothetical protein
MSVVRYGATGSTETQKRRLTGTVLQKRNRFAADNLEAAVIIASDEDKYGGPDALAVRWARKILADNQQLQPRRVA